VLVAIDTGSRRPVKILRARATRHFLFLLVRCRCGKRFGHRADRPTIICYECGRMAALRELRPHRVKAGRSSLKSASLKPAATSRAKAAAAAQAAKARPAARGAAARTVRRSVTAPAKRRTAR
jgi:hypothetical protein